MPRFYLPTALAPHTTLNLPDNIIRHIHVLRLNAGDSITLFNGTGNDFAATLQTIGKRHAECHIHAQRQPENGLSVFRLPFAHPHNPFKL